MRLIITAPKGLKEEQEDEKDQQALDGIGQEETAGAAGMRAREMTQQGRCLPQSLKEFDPT